MAKKRVVYHVVYEGGTWKAKREGGQQASVTGDTKKEVIDQARRLAKNNLPSQVIVHKTDGTIQTEWTYDDDPGSSPG